MIPTDKEARRLRTRGELVAEVLARDPETALVLEGIRGHMAAQRDLPTRRQFFWSGFLFGAFLVGIIWYVVLHV